MWYKIATLVVVASGALVAGVVYKLRKEDKELVLNLDKAYEAGKAQEAAANAVTAEEITIRT